MARTPVEELALSNSPNLGRALARDKAEDVPLTVEQKSEVAQLDELIAQAMKACHKGHTFRGRKNPAFANLASLVKTRELVLRGKRKPGKKSAEDILADANAFLKGVN